LSGPALSSSLASSLSYLNTKGLGVLSLNIRGSVGFGKSFALRDIGARRPDAVQDVLDAIQYLRSLPHLVDPAQIGIVGGSYGGWMVLQALTQSKHDLLLGIDVFGMSNMESFMSTTAPRRKKNRMLEYGSDPELLRKLSPVNHACDISAHLMIIQGANDIRVPSAQSTQMAAAVQKCREDSQNASSGFTLIPAASTAEVHVVVISGEGHGFVETESILLVLRKVAGFLLKHMKIHV